MSTWMRHVPTFNHKDTVRFQDPFPKNNGDVVFNEVDHVAQKSLTRRPSAHLYTLDVPGVFPLFIYIHFVNQGHARIHTNSGQ